jgi:hypothetical protein
MKKFVKSGKERKHENIISIVLSISIAAKFQTEVSCVSAVLSTDSILVLSNFSARL